MSTLRHPQIAGELYSIAVIQNRYLWNICCVEMFPLLISDQSPKHLTDGEGREVDPGTNAHLEGPQPSASYRGYFYRRANMNMELSTNNCNLPCQ